MCYVCARLPISSLLSLRYQNSNNLEPHKDQNHGQNCNPQYLTTTPNDSDLQLIIHTPTTALPQNPNFM